MSHTSLCREDARFYSTALRVRRPTSVLKDDLGQQSVQMTIFFTFSVNAKRALSSCEL